MRNFLRFIFVVGKVTVIALGRFRLFSIVGVFGPSNSWAEFVDERRREIYHNELWAARIAFNGEDCSTIAHRNGTRNEKLEEEGSEMIKSFYCHRSEEDARCRCFCLRLGTFPHVISMYTNSLVTNLCFLAMANLWRFYGRSAVGF